jgi:sodium bicarbonate transporter 10
MFQVPLKRVHIFTLIQLACLVILWVIKSFSTTSILFPLMVCIYNKTLFYQYYTV